MSDWRTVSSVLAGDSAEYAVDDFKKLFLLYTGATYQNVLIGSTNKWTFKDNIAQFQNPAGNFEYNIRTSAITADRDLTIPVIASNSNFVIDTVANTFTIAQTINATAIASTAEDILTLTVSDDAVGYIKLKNTASGNGVMSGGLFGKAGTSATSFFILGESTPANDTGTNPIIIIDSRRDDLTAITTRPLLAFRNMGTVYLQVNATNQISTSPQWATNFDMNNGLGVRMKDSGGTLKNLLFFSSGNLCSVGDLSGAGYNTSIWAGSTTAALQFTNTNQATFNKMAQAGAAEVIVSFSITDTANGSYVRVQNFSVTDAVYAPRIIVNNGDSTDQIEYMNQIGPAMDSGSAPVVSFFARRNDNTAITTRPLFQFNGRNNTALQINTKGDILFKTESQAGVAELLAEWRVSDDSTSSFKIVNATATDALFLPTIQAQISSAAAVTDIPLTIKALFDSADDSGSAPAILISPRLNTGAVIAARPLLRIDNFTTEVFRINTVNPTFLLTATALAGASEQIITFTVSDDTGAFVRLQNGFTTDGLFAPLLWSQLSTNSTASHAALYVYGAIQPGNDTSSSTPVMVFNTQTTNSLTIGTRGCFDFRNNSAKLLTIGNKGDVQIIGQAQASTAEQLLKLTVSDNATAYLLISNLSSTDAVFVPRIQSYNFGAGSANDSMRIINYIEAGADAGSVPIFTHDVRRSTEAAITTRVLYEWRNFGVAQMRYLADGSVDFCGTGQIINVTGSNSMSKIDGWQTLKRTGHFYGGGTTVSECTSGLLAIGGVFATTPTGSLSGNGGTHTIYSSKTSASGSMGYRTGAIVTRCDRDPKLSFRVACDRNQVRYFIGWRNVATQITAGTTVPLGNAEAGIMFGQTEANATYHIWTNNAGGAALDTNTGVTIVNDINAPIRVDLVWTNSNTTVTWTIWNNAGTQLGTGTINSQMPTTSHNLSFQYNVEVSDGTNSNWTIYSADAEAIK